MKKKPLWLVVTGLDGSGKTTLVDNLVNWFEENGLSVFRDRFPHDEYIVKTLLDKSKDPYTDRLLFALDNRLLCQEISEELKASDGYDIIITQRGLLDSYVHGAVQGFSYRFISELNHIEDLPKCDIMVHMVCEAGIAYSRICNDPDADKFEYPAYIGKQEYETRRVFTELTNKNPDLVHFFSAKNLYVDPPDMPPSEVFTYVKNK